MVQQFILGFLRNFDKRILMAGARPMPDERHHLPPPPPAGVGEGVGGTAGAGVGHPSPNGIEVSKDANSPPSAMIPSS